MCVCGLTWARRTAEKSGVESQDIVNMVNLAISLWVVNTVQPPINGLDTAEISGVDSQGMV